MHLPSESKVRVLLRIEGKTIREVCAELGCSPNGVHQHLRESLRHGWAEVEPRKSRSWRLTDEGRRVCALIQSELARARP
jgi:predicted transcriptional regulator